MKLSFIRCIPLGVAIFGCTAQELQAVNSIDHVVTNLGNSACKIVGAVDPKDKATATVVCTVLDAAGNVVSDTTQVIPVKDAINIVQAHPGNVHTKPAEALAKLHP